jgi:hypothetical protein
MRSKQLTVLEKAAAEEANIIDLLESDGCSKPGNSARWGHSLVVLSRAPNPRPMTP